MTPATSDALRARSRWLSGHGPTTPAEVLAKTAAWCEQHSVTFDIYGEGALIESFEARVAALLGYPAARFFPSGTMAQQIALRVWCDRAGLAHFGMHPTSHLELHEQRGYQRLHQLAATLVGPADTPLLAEHFAAVPERLAALLVELPIREAGGQCPSWAELDALKIAARDADTRLHLDGARLWECAAGYGKTYAEICRGFDSCYVSFYKGIGALSGAMLLGPADFIAEAALWQRRSGGNLYTLAPNVASAAMAFDARLERMPRYFERATAVARTLAAIDGIAVLPQPPHTNMMHVFLPAEPERLTAARDEVAREHGLWSFNAARSTGVPGRSRVELYIGDAAMLLEDAEIEAAFRELVAHARA